MSRLLRLEADVLMLADTGLIWSDVDAFIDLSARTHATSDPVQAEALIEEADDSSLERVKRILSKDVHIFPDKER